MSGEADEFARALSLAGAGRLAEALPAVDAQLARTPGHAAALALKGALLTETGDPAAAVPLFEQAVLLAPANAVTRSNFGNALARLDRPEAAIEQYSRALEINPAYAVALVNRAGQYLELKQDEAGLRDAEAGLALSPRMPAAHRTLSRALLALYRFDEALAAVDAAIALQPGNTDGHAHRGTVLSMMGRQEDSLRCFEQAVAINPADVENRYRRALARLRLHDFRGGWADHEVRWRTKLFRGHSTAYRLERLLPALDLNCDPAEIAGKAVLLVDEQGVGDHIMFASMVPDLLASASRVAWFGEPRMLSLLARSFPQITFYPAGKGLPEDPAAFDKVIPIGSLGRLYRNRIEDFPGTPYLAPSPQVAAAWRERLGPKTRALRIGISWRGGGTLTGGPKRSMPLETLRPLLKRSDCEFVSLQYGEAEAEVAEFNQTLEQPIRVFPRAEIDDFEQLAGLALGLDLVISVQTAIIHLAGALGVPALVMVPFVAEWRYGAAGSTLPWYSSVSLFRQPERDAWAPVIDEIGAELNRLMKGLPAATS